MIRYIPVQDDNGPLIHDTRTGMFMPMARVDGAEDLAAKLNNKPEIYKAAHFTWIPASSTVGNLHPIL